MDPVTAAITAALVAGVINGVIKISESAIVEGYEGLKALIKEKFGTHSPIALAVEELEKKPDSTARQAVLQEETHAAKADQDRDLLLAAENLLAKIKDHPGGQAIVNQVVTGDRNIFSGTGDITVSK